MTPHALKQLEADLWRSADTLRANSDLKASEYSTPVLGLIFLKFADNKYRRFEKDILEVYAKLKGSRRERTLSEIAIEKCGFYLPDHARYDHLLSEVIRPPAARRPEETRGVVPAMTGVNGARGKTDEPMVRHCPSVSVVLGHVGDSGESE